MEKLVIKPTQFTPSIILDSDTCRFEISGRSTSENAHDFYRPVLRWVKEYTTEYRPETTLNLQLDYFNSSSSKCILDLIKLIARLKSDKNIVTINWFYQTEDVDMKETGEDFESLSKIKFNFIKVAET